MLNLAKLLQAAIALDGQISRDKGLELSRQQQLENAYVALDVELAEVANTSEWFKVWKTNRGKAAAGESAQETLLTEYVDALDFFLLVAAKQTWSHLIVMPPDEVGALAKQSPARDADQQYLLLKRLLMNSYYDRRQEDFRHAWRLFLKWGLVDFGFSEEAIQQAYEAKNTVNYRRQADGY